MTAHAGSCHCGAIRLEFRTDKPLAPRACQCRFCRRHNARMVSDPDGLAVLTLGREARRYRFATMTTEYLFCGRCGCYVGATAEIEGGTYATLNLNAFDNPCLDIAATPVSYEGESCEQKAFRRRNRWSPVLSSSSR